MASIPTISEIIDDAKLRYVERKLLDVQWLFGIVDSDDEAFFEKTADSVFNSEHILKHILS